MGELGRGAFGKVHKGVMKEVTNANIYSDTSERNPNVRSKDSLRTLKDNMKDELLLLKSFLVSYYAIFDECLEIMFDQHVVHVNKVCVTLV